MEKPTSNNNIDLEASLREKKERERKKKEEEWMDFFLEKYIEDLDLDTEEGKEAFAEAQAYFNKLQAGANPEDFDSNTTYGEYIRDGLIEDRERIVKNLSHEEAMKDYEAKKDTLEVKRLFSHMRHILQYQAEMQRIKDNEPTISSDLDGSFTTSPYKRAKEAFDLHSNKLAELLEDFRSSKNYDYGIEREIEEGLEEGEKEIADKQKQQKIDNARDRVNNALDGDGQKNPDKDNNQKRSSDYNDKFEAIKNLPPETRAFVQQELPRRYVKVEAQLKGNYADDYDKIKKATNAELVDMLKDPEEDADKLANFQDLIDKYASQRQYEVEAEFEGKYKENYIKNLQEKIFRSGESLKSLQAEYEKALADGDQEKAKKIEAERNKLSDLIHQMRLDYDRIMGREGDDSPEPDDDKNGDKDSDKLKSEILTLQEKMDKDGERLKALQAERQKAMEANDKKRMKELDDEMKAVSDIIRKTRTRMEDLGSDVIIDDELDDGSEPDLVPNKRRTIRDRFNDWRKRRQVKKILESYGNTTEFKQIKDKAFKRKSSEEIIDLLSETGSIDRIKEARNFDKLVSHSSLVGVMDKLLQINEGQTLIDVFSQGRKFYSLYDKEGFLDSLIKSRDIGAEGLYKNLERLEIQPGSELMTATLEKIKQAGYDYEENVSKGFGTNRIVAKHIEILKQAEAEKLEEERKKREDFLDYAMMNALANPNAETMKQYYVEISDRGNLLSKGKSTEHFNIWNAIFKKNEKGALKDVLLKDLQKDPAAELTTPRDELKDLAIKEAPYKEGARIVAEVITNGSDQQKTDRLKQLMTEAQDSIKKWSRGGSNALQLKTAEIYKLIEKDLQLMLEVVENLEQ